MTFFRVKTITRIAVVQTLYQYHIDKNTNINLIMQYMLDFYRYDYLAKDHIITNSSISYSKENSIKLSVNYFKILTRSTVTNIFKIDKILYANLNIIGSNNLTPLVINLLRTAICELRILNNLPYRVIISDYTDIASEMLDEHHVGFINVILDKIAIKN